jgi:glutamate synthase (NADPH/NADH) small chain
MPSWGPLKVLKVNGELFGMKLVKCTSVYNSEHRFYPTYDNNVTTNVEADIVILAIGQRPNIAYAESSLKTGRGLIMVDSNTQVTSDNKVFAGGDAVTGSATVILAMSAGKKAAKGIDEYIKARHLEQI